MKRRLFSANLPLNKRQRKAYKARIRPTLAARRKAIFLWSRDVFRAAYAQSFIIGIRKPRFISDVDDFGVVEIDLIGEAR